MTTRVKKTTDIKAAEEKKEVKPAAEAKEVKPVEEVKTEPAKRGRKPAAAKAEETKTEPAKRGRKPAAEKKAEEAVKKNVVLQFDFGQYVSDEIVDACVKAYEAENKTKIQSIDVYVKPADKKAYYVVNGKSAGFVDL